MTKPRVLLSAMCLIASAVAPVAEAQDSVPGNPWSRGTTISAGAGVATAASRSGGVLGAAVGWELTPRFGLEADASWLDRPGASEAFTAALTAHIAARGREVVSPYLKGGIGLYRLSFVAGGQGVPEFYRRRVARGGPSSRTEWTFTDPAFALGAGVTIFADRHLALRPEIQTILVTRDARVHVVTAVTLQLSYHFEDHLITMAGGSE